MIDVDTLDNNNRNNVGKKGITRKTIITELYNISIKSLVSLQNEKESRFFIPDHPPH